MNAKAPTTKPKKPLNFEKYSGAAEALNAITEAKEKADGRAPLNMIDRDDQVRKKFDIESLKLLAKDFDENGVLQPVLLKRKPDNRFKLIAGERRYLAAEIGNLEDIPYRLVPDDADDLAIRKIQVSENEKRESLTPYERTMGVAEDVAKYGNEVALQIWGHSASWISKRAAAARLPAPIIALLRDDVITDLEMLNSLNNIFMLDEKEFSAIVGDIEDGTSSYNRDQLRDKETLIKERIQRQSEKPLGGAKTTRPAAKSMVAAAGAGKPSSGKQPGQPVDQDNAGKKESPDNVSHGAVTPSSKSKVVPPIEPVASPFQLTKNAGPTRESVERRLKILREEMYHWGLANQKQFLEIQDLVGTLGTMDGNDEQLENWVKWAGFQSIVLPLVAVLGDKTSEIFLRRLAADLKKTGAGPLWDSLHPLIDAKGGTVGKRDETPDMPAGWRL